MCWKEMWMDECWMWCSRWRRASVLSFSGFYEQLPARSPSGSETSEKQPSALLRENWTQISWEKMEYNHKYLFFLPSFHHHSCKNTPAVEKLPSTSSLPSLWSTWSFFEMWFMTCSAEVEHGWSSDLLIFFKIEKWTPGHKNAWLFLLKPGVYCLRQHVFICYKIEKGFQTRKKIFLFFCSSLGYFDTVTSVVIFTPLMKCLKH